MPIANDIVMEQKEVDTDDTTAIQYIPYQVDYFGKVFHPKQFVKEHDVVGVSSLKSTQDDFQKKQPIYTSIYNGIMDISNEKEEKQIKHSFTPDEEKQASELYHRILEIEKEHANESKVSCIDDQSSLQFVVNQCGCPECSPRLRDNDIMYCELCDVVLRDDNWIHHTQSICHQVKRQNKVHVYVNPFMNPSSSAFKVMTAMGWEEGQGLGKEGQGRLEPIPTRLKNNRLGIGAADSM